jgi:hypothetical protein
MLTRLSVAICLVLSVLAINPAAAPTGGLSTKFKIVGEVEQAKTFDLAQLKALPVATANVTYVAGTTVNRAIPFTGALLWDLLSNVGIVTDPAIRNDILRKIVVVIGADGYTAVFGVGEIHPNFGGAQILVVYGQNGTDSLGNDGFARIVAPGDKLGGRFVSNIIKIIVADGSDLNDNDDGHYSHHKW